MSNSGEFNVDLAKIEEITISNAGINNNTSYTSLDKDTFHFNLNFTFEPGVNIGLSKMRVVFKCEIKTLSKNEEAIDVTGYFDIVYLFKIENLSDLVTIEGNNIEINKHLLATVGNIVYATSRGIIYTRCLGTILKNIILPIISTDELVSILLPQPQETN